MGICSAPVSIPLACGIGFVVISIVIGIVGILISIYAGIIACACGGLGCIGLGVVCFSGSVPTGCMFLGGGLTLTALAAAAGFGAFVGTKELIKLIINGIRNVNRSRKEKKLQKMSKDMNTQSTAEGETSGWAYTQKESNPKDSFSMSTDVFGNKSNEGGDDNE